jgi:Methyltransferase small domain
MERGLPVLRDYLDHIGFAQLYKFLVTARCYHTNPNALSWSSLERMADIDSYVTGDGPALGLAACLMLKVSVPQRILSPFEQRVAERLVDAGLVVRTHDNFRMGAYQLISAHDMPLLIDSRVNYPGAIAHQVYFGSDSLHLLYYVDTSGIAPSDRVIDLGTGSGVIGLALARSSHHVTMTDISPQALELAQVNRLLNRVTERVTIRDERCEETVARPERYDVVTFNPPFLPLPDGLGAPVFARGLGPDGLGYCRMLLENLDHLLLPGGTAYTVASLLGTSRGPFFTEELHEHADRHGLRIDVFIDSATPLTAGAPMFQALGAFLHGENAAIPAPECQRRVEELLMQTLGATHAYLSVLVIRAARAAHAAHAAQDDRSAVRVFHWTAGTPFPSPTSNPV